MTSTSSTATADQILDVVKQQHEYLQQMLTNVQEADAAYRKAAYSSLSRFLAQHEAAEAAYIESAAPSADHEERWVQRLSELDPTSGDFLEKFQEFSTDLVKHTQVEVAHTMPKALGQMATANLQVVLAAFERVSEHPDIPSNDS
ncbi:MAG: hypothetical protein ACK5MT_11270 [Actinomycetales bacterium]